MNRSYLFIPGNSPAMIQTLDVFESDAVILDLEDAVDSENKDSALELVNQYLLHFQPKQVAVFIRLNASLYETEIMTLNQTNCTGYVVPKASVESLKAVTSLTNKPLIALIETPRSILNALDIADLKQVKGLILGAEDLSTALRIKRTKPSDEINYARQMIVMAAKAANIEAIDTPFTDPLDEAFLVKDCQKAYQFGMTGKTAIHPNQVDTINQIFVPSKEEIAHAKRIVLKASTESKGAFSLDGKMIDKPIIIRAKALLEQAKQYNLIESGDDLE